jgi:hypothetical protein
MSFDAAGPVSRRTVFAPVEPAPTTPITSAPESPIDLGDRVEAAPVRTTGPRALPPGATLDGLAAAYREGGSTRASEWVAAHPASIRTLAAMTPDELRAGIADRLRGDYTLFAGARALQGATAVQGAVEARIDGIVRARVSAGAVAGIEPFVRALATDPEILLPRIREAPPGTVERRLAEELQLDGGPDDLARLRAGAETAQTVFLEVQSHLQGTAWEIDDVPATRDRVLGALGITREPGTMGAVALGPSGRTLATTAGGVELVGEAVAMIAEAAHAVHAAAVVGSAGAMAMAAPSAAAILVGIALHLEIHRQQEERRRLFAQLGL